MPGTSPGMTTWKQTGEKLGSWLFAMTVEGADYAFTVASYTG